MGSIVVGYAASRERDLTAMRSYIAFVFYKANRAQEKYSLCLSEGLDWDSISY